MIPNPFNVPLLDNAFDIEANQYIRIVLSSATARYSIYYPSGMFREEISTEELTLELTRYIPNHERIEEVIAYATNWRRVAYYPDTGLFYFIFPDGRVYRGGLGNRASFGDNFIWQQSED